jgi:UDP-N-acetylglucosamine/UDP-N-acetylgalactosamine diphosphorylase
MSFDQIKELYTRNNQGHVLDGYAELAPNLQQELLARLAEIDVERANFIYKNTLSKSGKHAGKLSPLPGNVLETSSSAKAQEYKRLGLDLIAKNKVAVLLLAGGQGTRLVTKSGISYSKRALRTQRACSTCTLYSADNSGLLSQKSLFQLQAERILALQKLAPGAQIPWYIMTSGPTRKPTEEFFKKNNYFGVKAENVFFFNQGVLPAFEEATGKIIMEQLHVPSTVNPNCYNLKRLLMEMVEFMLP